MKKLLIILAVLFFAGCKDEPDDYYPNGVIITSGPNITSPNLFQELYISYHQHNFENRDANLPLMCIGFNGIDKSMILKLDVDANGLLVMNVEDCNLKEAPLIIWECLSSE